jgi:hypothetical protein
MALEDIPPIQRDVFKWRMDQAVRNAAKAGEESVFPINQDMS